MKTKTTDRPKTGKKASKAAPENKPNPLQDPKVRKRFLREEEERKAYRLTMTPTPRLARLLHEIGEELAGFWPGQTKDAGIVITLGDPDDAVRPAALLPVPVPGQPLSETATVADDLPANPPASIRGVLLADPSARRMVKDFFRCWSDGLGDPMTAEGLGEQRGSLMGMLLVSEALLALAKGEGVPLE
ncbi:hypothetical protein [Zavarzinella formosa]|uniref:hypothetical protein n=1 Tax=Zavarzinella formosa TaxID=360055 RepID=UPI0002E7C70E|nr:hypothetical protein [Zavarzinella formosa]